MSIFKNKIGHREKEVFEAQAPGVEGAGRGVGPGHGDLGGNPGL